MIQDAINTIASLQQKYENSFSLEIFTDGSVILHYMEDIDSDEVFHKDFADTQDMLEWMEENLIDTKSAS